MFITRMPSTAKPRSTSIEPMRSDSVTGAADDGKGRTLASHPAGGDCPGAPRGAGILESSAGRKQYPIPGTGVFDTLVIRVLPSRSGAVMDFTYSIEEQAFRGEILSWIRENVPGDGGSRAWPIPEDEAELARAICVWERRLNEGGWAGITWPKEYGGRGAPPIEQFIFQEEMAAYKTQPTH